MTIYLLALSIGVVAGLRALAAPAAVCWAAYVGWLNLHGTWAAFLGYAAVPYVLTVLALGELVIDALPSTPARTQPAPFASRLINGAFCGAVIGIAAGSSMLGAGMGAVGALIGTLGGYALRTRLTRANHGHDRPVALLEDVLALVSALWIVMSV